MGLLIIHCNDFRFCFYFIDYKTYVYIPLCGSQQGAYMRRLLQCL